MRVPRRPRAMRRLVFLAVVSGLIGAAAAREAPALGDRGRARVDASADGTFHASDDDADLGLAEDRVAFLPGYGVPPFSTVPGRLRAGRARTCTTGSRGARRRTGSAPTVPWLNGGPGSSVRLGWSGDRPCWQTRRAADAKPPAWTRQANVFVLEAPRASGTRTARRREAAARASTRTTARGDAPPPSASLRNPRARRQPLLRHRRVVRRGARAHAGARHLGAERTNVK